MPGEIPADGAGGGGTGATPTTAGNRAAVAAVVGGIGATVVVSVPGAGGTAAVVAVAGCIGAAAVVVVEGGVATVDVARTGSIEAGAAGGPKKIRSVSPASGPTIGTVPGGKSSAGVPRSTWTVAAGPPQMFRRTWII